MGIQPRTAIGQKANLDVLMLVVDGRQLGHSIGTTVGECADIMERYGAVQAINLDGGASSIMYYNNHPVTIPQFDTMLEDGFQISLWLRTNNQIETGEILIDKWTGQ